MGNNANLQVKQIGVIRSAGESFRLEIDKPYRAAMKEMDRFSHIIVLWWGTEHDNDKSRSILETELPYADNTKAGVFACRSEYRPNPILFTVCEIINMNMETGTVELNYIDGFDGSPVLDIKPYFPVSERVNKFKVPPWVKDWPDCYEDAWKLAELFQEME